MSYVDTPGVTTSFNHASFYSYDIHGNVDTLLQDYGLSGTRPNMMNKNGNRYKKIVYEYDLISGKVNQVKYQPRFSDQWTHRYFYDAENRLTEVETSEDGYTWEKEARYEYYLHGPLARTVLGQQQVQGMDYAYTLQGWLKGINSSSAAAAHDIGGDARAGGGNQYVGRDAIGLSLNYFDGEYKPIAPGVMPFPSYRSSGTAMPDSVYRPLYNGNISSALVNIRKFEENGHVPAFYNYRYDQLNRYIGQDGYFNYSAGTNSFGSWNPVYTYQERVSYDANGNIQTLNRHNINPGGDLMDDLSYKYYPGTNQLRQVTDQVPDWRFGANAWDKIIDIDNQPDTSNYVYDSIGNLVADKSEKITGIQWNVYGKITEITRNPLTTDQNTTFWTRYRYDAQGNRIAKTYKWYNKDQSRYELAYTWYVRDAQGNLMSTYSTASTDTAESNLPALFVQQKELPVYGSSRLGMYYPENRNGAADNEGNTGPWINYGYYGTTHYRGARQYELSNHLGNVLTTISDRKIGVYSGSSLILDSALGITAPKVDYYEAEKLAAYDYFPFGMIARLNVADGKYRFGFNGKENDNEVKGGIGAQQDYGMRVYDPRLGRFLSVDPLAPEYPSNSTYAFAENNPVKFIDLDGLEKSEKSTTNFIPGIGAVNADKVKAQAEFYSKWAANKNSVGLVKKSEYGASLSKRFRDIAKQLNPDKSNAPLVSGQFYGAAAAMTPGEQLAILKYNRDFAIPSDDVEANNEAALNVLGIALSKPLEYLFSKSGQVLGQYFRFGAAVTKSELSIITKHLEQFGKHAENEIMLKRLNQITKGELKATEIDIAFAKHELREAELMKYGKMKYEEAHEQVLKEQGMYHPEYDKKLYTKEALDAGNKAMEKSNN